MHDWKEQAKLAVIREAGNLPDGVTEIAKFVIQEWSRLNRCWMDGPSEAYDTEEEALERETEISGWKHVDRTRIVHRTVTVTERGHRRRARQSGGVRPTTARRLVG
jgi:hypothetical protein